MSVPLKCLRGTGMWTRRDHATRSGQNPRPVRINRPAAHGCRVRRAVAHARRAWGRRVVGRRSNDSPGCRSQHRCLRLPPPSMPPSPCSSRSPAPIQAPPVPSALTPAQPLSSGRANRSHESAHPQCWPLLVERRSNDSRVRGPHVDVDDAQIAHCVHQHGQRLDSVTARVLHRTLTPPRPRARLDALRPLRRLRERLVVVGWWRPSNERHVGFGFERAGKSG